MEDGFSKAEIHKKFLEEGKEIKQKFFDAFPRVSDGGLFVILVIIQVQLLARGFSKVWLLTKMMGSLDMAEDFIRIGGLEKDK